MNIFFIGCIIFCGNAIISSTIFLLSNIWVNMYILLPSVIIILLRLIWQQYDLGEKGYVTQITHDWKWESVTRRICWEVKILEQDRRVKSRRGVGFRRAILRPLSTRTVGLREWVASWNDCRSTSILGGGQISFKAGRKEIAEWIIN